MELASCDELVIAVYLDGESIMLVDVVQYGKENDQQLFVEVDLPLLVDRVHIDDVVVLHNGISPSYRPCPVDFVEPRVHVLDDEHEELRVVVVELYQRQQDVEEGVVALATAFVHLRHLAVVDNRGVVALVIVEHHHCAVDPDGEVVDEVLLLLGQW